MSKSKFKEFVSKLELTIGNGPNKVLKAYSAQDIRYLW